MGRSVLEFDKLPPIFFNIITVHLPKYNPPLIFYSEKFHTRQVVRGNILLSNALLCPTAATSNDQQCEFPTSRLQTSTR